MQTEVVQEEVLPRMKDSLEEVRLSRHFVTKYGENLPAEYDIYIHRFYESTVKAERNLGLLIKKLEKELSNQ